MKCAATQGLRIDARDDDHISHQSQACVADRRPCQVISHAGMSHRHEATSRGYTYGLRASLGRDPFQAKYGHVLLLRRRIYCRAVRSCSIVFTDWGFPGVIRGHVTIIMFVFKEVKSEISHCIIAGVDTSPNLVVEFSYLAVRLQDV